MDFNPVGIKYWGGWGDGSDVSFSRDAASASTMLDIFKAIKKYSVRDRKYLKDKWKERYLFYAMALLDDEDQLAVLNDFYMKNIEKEIG